MSEPQPLPALCEVGKYNPDGTVIHPFNPGQCRDRFHAIIPTPVGCMFVCKRHADGHERAEQSAREEGQR